MFIITATRERTTTDPYNRRRRGFVTQKLLVLLRSVASGVQAPSNEREVALLEKQAFPGNSGNRFERASFRLHKAQPRWSAVSLP